MVLTDKQRRVVDDYVVDMNATQAAIRSGYKGDGSLDRVDAAVWALTELMVTARPGPAAVVETGFY